MSAESQPGGTPRVLIAGGGIAGLEALLALADLAGDRIELVLAAPEPEFRYRPMAVDEPFSFEPYARRALEPAVEEVGGRFIQAALAELRPDQQVAALGDGSEVEYAAAIVCVGARPVPAFEHALSFVVPGPQLDFADLLTRAREAEDRPLAFVVPSGVTWTLPLYELAMLTAKHAAERGDAVDIVLVTPESAPLAIFGPRASEAVGALLKARGIAFHGGAHAREVGENVLTLDPGGEELRAAAVVALPRLEGPRIPGVPTDASGFIPIDEHARVAGADGLYAAGDGTSFPIKQGGLGTQQADAAAEHIAARFGAELEPKPFRPVLRGKLIVGDETMSMQTEVAGGGGEGVVSPDYLWWPPHKVSGRYLAPWLAGDDTHADPEPPAHSIEVEVSLPHEWHREPMALDPYGPIGID
jgi:sulfide:quinone oxidoreductase